MEEIKYLKDSKVEITARRIDNELYIHQDSLVALLKDYKKQFSLNVVVVPKGTLPLDKLIQKIEEYEQGQKTHTIKRTPERMRTILAATGWCKKFAKRLTK